MRRRWYILDDDHNPIPVEIGEWSEWRSDHDGPVRVGFTEIGGGISVSTVFLGFDHNFSFDDRGPVLFETMVFDGTDASGLSGYIYRYHTWDEALAGHNETVVKVRRAMIRLA
jgi:hypothetical protein